MKFTDRVSVGQTKRTEEGYLVATARVARTGVQQYLASELGDVAIKAGFNPGDVVRVMRSPDEVFHEDSLRTVTRLPVTINHPAEDVTADNWSELSVGDVGDAYSKESGWIVVNPMLKDTAAIEAAETTHREISMGYRAEIAVASDKSIADFEQKNIRYNHLALVPKGRAGRDARIGDSWGVSPVNDNEPGKPGTTPTTPKDAGGHMTKTVILGDAAVTVPVADAVAIEAFKASSAEALADAQSAHEAALADKDAELAKLQAQLDDAKAKVLSDADIDAKVAARSELIATAKAIAPEIKTDGLKDADIRKAVVTAKLGDAAIADKSDAYIDARFDILAEGSTKQNPVRDSILGGIQTFGDDAQQMNDAHSDYVARLTRQTKGA